MYALSAKIHIKAFCGDVAEVSAAHAMIEAAEKELRERIGKTFSVTVDEPKLVGVRAKEPPLDIPEKTAA